MSQVFAIAAVTVGRAESLQYPLADATILAMTGAPDQQVARLRAELAAAQADQRVAHLQAELADAQAGAEHLSESHYPMPPTGPQDPPDALFGFDTSLGGGTANTWHFTTRDGSLVAPPRHVPAAMLLSAFGWKWWEAWALLMIGVTPIALWMFVPWTATVAGAATLIVVITVRIRRGWDDFALLRHGLVAEQVRLASGNTGTYYSGTTYRNVRLAAAHGWQVTRRWYSGPGTKSGLEFTVNGTPGSMTLHGLPYAGGVILADPRKPGRARCVSQFAIDIDRDSTGNLVGAPPLRVVIGFLFTLALWAGWAVLVLWWQLVVVAGTAAHV